MGEFTSQGLEIPNGWHVSWLGYDDGAYTCQITRHDEDLDYISELTFVSRRGWTQNQAMIDAIKIIRENGFKDV